MSLFKSWSPFVQQGMPSEYVLGLGRLGGSVGWTTAFGSGHDLGVLGSSPTLGSQLHEESASLSDLLLAHALSHCLSLSSK